MTAGPVRRFRALPLRSRLALLTSLAVAVAVAAVSVAAWLLTRAQLLEELDRSLENTAAPQEQVVEALVRCRAGVSPDPPVPDRPGFAYTQLVGADGDRCVARYSRAVRVTARDVEVAAGDAEEAMHTSRTDSGEAVRVHTVRQTVTLPGTGQRVPVAVSLARPLTEVDAALSRLALLLTALAGIGVVGAGAAGLWVARAGLRPVDRLTDAAEHVARTEDLTVRIPVEGEDEIARLSRSFNAMTGALASSRDRQAQLIADAGHELRTPLTSLRTNVELLARVEESGRALPAEDRRALLASVKAQTAELAALIGDLQELARPDAVAQGRLEVVALHDALDQALGRVRLRGPELVFTRDVRPWFVRAEPAALERALVNVLDNAVKFSPPGGTVEVRLVDGALSVRDHGQGVPEEELPHVFDRFWRSPSARSLPGSGLGLSIVARTVRQAGGTVALVRAEGGGARAEIRLPGAPTPPPGPAGPRG
ncbi:HAMP domain-containing sensor histidine kinase [Streptomyces fradiae]|uniref:HAMP domain-containing sensor histidine kinase n=1 Tax=Streptomyces fradiae TaxID=1906 RepID=UPI002943C3AA|nr:HAMP domain-containing sensor histidine kinase [Streptomyces fradiae]WOI58682.1 HAMP domain-containing sensor histidine kinase [Streptomyces fradiae]